MGSDCMELVDVVNTADESMEEPHDFHWVTTCCTFDSPLEAVSEAQYTQTPLVIPSHFDTHSHP